MADLSQRPNEFSIGDNRDMEENDLMDSMGNEPESDLEGPLIQGVRPSSQFEDRRARLRNRSFSDNNEDNDSLVIPTLCNVAPRSKAAGEGPSYRIWLRPRSGGTTDLAPRANCPDPLINCTGTVQLGSFTNPSKTAIREERMEILKAILQLAAVRPDGVIGSLG